MAKSRNHSSELDQLRKELKNCRSETKHLKRELAKANKNFHRLEDLEEIVKESTEFLDTVNKMIEYLCPDCGAELEVADIGIRKLYKCTKCKYRRSEK